MTQQSQYLGSILPENASTFSKTNISKLLKALHMLDFELFHCEEQSTPDMTVKVSGGRFTKNGVYTEFSLDGNKDVTTTNSGTFTAPTTNPKIDLLYYDMGTDALGITAGAEAASPAQPTMPSPIDKIPVCLIYHRVGSTKILNSDDSTNSYIMGRNVRPFLNIGLDKLGAALDCNDKEVSKATFKDTSSKMTTVAASGASYAINMENGNVFDITLDQNCTFTFTNPPASGNLGVIILFLRSVTYTATLPASVDYRSGTAPTLTASGVDILIYTTTDGGTIYHGGDFSLDSK